MSQILCSDVNSCETTKAKSTLAPCLGEGIKPGRLGIQGSNQIRIEAPFPTWKQATLATRCLMPIKLFQKEEALPEKGSESQLFWTLYFAFNTWTQRQSFPETIHQPNLERRAWLKSQKFLKPKPPSFWGQHKEDHDIRVQYEPDFAFGFHQNLDRKSVV